MPSETTRPQAGTRTITVTGQRLRVAIRKGDGTRTPLLLMNGIGVNLEVLQPFVDALDLALEVIRFDVPGTGGSPTPLIPYRFSGLARLVARMFDQLGSQQIDVLGVSWGGALAQQFAFQYPIRCRRLILVSTGTGAFMVPGNPAALVKIATPRRYQNPAYMAQIAGEIYGGKMRTRPDLAHEFARNARLGSELGYAYQMLGGAGWSSIFWKQARKSTLVGGSVGALLLALHRFPGDMAPGMRSSASKRHQRSFCQQISSSSIVKKRQLAHSANATQHSER